MQSLKFPGYPDRVCTLVYLGDHEGRVWHAQTSGPPAGGTPTSGTPADSIAAGGTPAEMFKVWLVLQVLKVPLCGEPGWV